MDPSTFVSVSLWNYEAVISQGSDRSMLYWLFGIGRLKVHCSAHNDYIASTSVTLDWYSRFSWTALSLKSKVSTEFIDGDNRQSAEAENIIPYVLYPSLPLFARVAFGITGSSSSHSASLSMHIRVIPLLMVCAILSARLFDYGEYAAVTFVYVSLSFSSFFQAAD